MDAHTSSAGLVQMHPTASRSHAAPSPVYAAPSAPSPPPPRPSPPAPVSRTASSASNAGASSPAAGLNLNPAQFPLYSTLPNVHPIRVITAQQYAQIQHEYTSLALPEKVLMPWSHLGADIAGTNAAAYFGFARGDAAAAPNYCGLTLVCADPPQSRKAHSRHRADSLASSFSSASSSSSSHFSTNSQDSAPIPPPSPSPSSLLVSSFSPSSILTDQVPASFNLPTKIPTRVNLRQFGLQAAKYASVSDIVVYGRDGVDENVVEVACRMSEAIDGLRRERRAKGEGRQERYNVYIIEDSFATFEKHFPQLVAIDSHGFQRNKLNFFEREREEMRVLTQASEIAENVWLGNAQDVPLPPLPSYRSSTMTTSDSSSSLASIDDGNPLSFSICIEAHDTAAMADEPTLRRAGEGLDALEELIGGFEDVYITDSAEDHTPPITQSVKILRPAVADIIHLETLSTGGVCTTASQQRNLISSLINLILWIRSQASPSRFAGSTQLPRRILLHCGDGYTETSLLALSYIMLVRKCCLPEAYLFLQRDADRSFFVHPKDVEVLEKVERVIREILEDEMLATIAEEEGGNEMRRSDSGFASNSSGSASLSSIAKFATLPEIEQAEQIKTVMTTSTPTIHPWFYSPSFDGHFPSRILPFLYLGNLAHATNALMLKELGITHVVSMGESALIPPRPTNIPTPNPTGRARPISLAEKASVPTNSLWLENRLNNISVLDVKAIADDGIDSLDPYLLKAVAFIDQAQKSGGKVLVHCRVGVSRSASIVIAYLMKCLQLDLSSAYLLTRSRRLNILIQPSLPFFLCLHSFEAELIRSLEIERRERGEEEDTGEEELGRAGLKRSNRLAWSFLANEIASLNARFLC